METDRQHKVINIEKQMINKSSDGQVSEKSEGKPVKDQQASKQMKRKKYTRCHVCCPSLQLLYSHILYFSFAIFL